MTGAPPWVIHLPPGMSAAELDLTGRATLPAAWLALWSAHPGRTVLVAGPDGPSVSAGELAERSGRVAARFLAAGLEPGDRVLFSAATSFDLVVAHVAALRAGLVVVPMNTAYREREVAHIVGDARPRAAVVDDADRAAWIRAAGGPIVVTGPEVALPGAAAAADLDLSVPAGPALVGYTSGTTGSPKGAALTHANLLAGTESVRLAWRWEADDQLVLCLPLFHAHGLCVGLHGTLLAGAAVTLLPRFDVDAVLDAARDTRATMFFGVPTMYRRLAGSPRAGELGRLRLCVSGSASLPAELHDELRRVAGQSVLERYGMTETLMNVSNPYDGERRPGSVGLPLPGVDVRLDAGEICVRGPNVFGGYLERPAATRQAFRDGWFLTGDLGAFDDDGYLRILGRSKELIISGGFNVYPREVEEVLLGHAGVDDVAVVGTPSDEWGETVTAYVVSAAGVTADDLLAHARPLLAGYKQPRIIRFVDTLPRNALGKVQKHELTTGP